MKDTRTATIRFRLLKLSDNKIVQPLPPMVPPDRLDHQPGWSAWTGWPHGKLGTRSGGPVTSRDHPGHQPGLGGHPGRQLFPQATPPCR